MKTLTQVQEWNRKKRNDGQYIMMFTLGNGSMADKPRQRGWVIYTKNEQGATSARFYQNKDEALLAYNQD